jgi:multidrug efflux pump subunit AcrB
VSLNSSPDAVAALNDLPAKVVNGATVYLRDVAHVGDGFAVQTKMVRMDGQRSALLAAPSSRRAAVPAPTRCSGSPASRTCASS